MGASGGVFALLGACLLQEPWSRPRILFWLLSLVTLSFSPLADHWAHFGGLLSGLLLALFLERLPTPSWRGALIPLLWSCSALMALQHALREPELESSTSQAAPLLRGWLPGPSLPFCEESYSDGLHYLCWRTWSDPSAQLVALGFEHLRPGIWSPLKGRGRLYLIPAPPSSLLLFSASLEKPQRLLRLLSSIEPALRAPQTSIGPKVEPSKE